MSDAGVRSLTRTTAVLGAPHAAAAAAPLLVCHPLHGLVRMDARRLEDGDLCIEAPAQVDAAFPQLDIGGGDGWAVWPRWRLPPAHAPEDEPLAWCSSGLLCVPLPAFGDVRVEFPPSLPGAPALAASALAALVAGFGPLPWSPLRLLLEPQAQDRGREKGYALPYPSGMWCRVQLRPGAAPARSRRSAAAAEVIVHELLHHVLEFDTPPGHVLTEGLVTYLARLLVARAGLAPYDWLARQERQAGRELRMWHLDAMRPATASVRFFRAEAARRAAYRSGYLVMRRLDVLCRGELVDICRRLLARTRSRGMPLTEGRFVAALRPAARRAYRAALR